VDGEVDSGGDRQGEAEAVGAHGVLMLLGMEDAGQALVDVDVTAADLTSASGDPGAAAMARMPSWAQR
jgi:hypothetical protein